MTPLKQLSLPAQHQAQHKWALTPIADRLRLVRKLRHHLAEHAKLLASTVSRDPAQTLTAEVLPLLEACRFWSRMLKEFWRPDEFQHPRRSGYAE